MNYNILVNTTDSFEDCWQPFFRLFKKYWPDYRGKIYLNTETKEFKFEELNIISIKNGLVGKPWSQCLKYALDFIKEENIIYLQEDYFLHSSVNNKLLESFFIKFKENNFDCLHLTDQCTNGPFNKNTGVEDVWEIKKGANYRLSTQAAFWKKDSLLKLIRTWESGWQFEHYGTKRSNYILNKVMCVSQDKIIKDKNEILPYVFTGIIKGKWNESVVELFSKNDKQIDFNKRGFYDNTPTQKQSIPIANKFKKQIYNFRSSWDIIYLKVKNKMSTIINKIV